MKALFLPKQLAGSGLMAIALLAGNLPNAYAQTVIDSEAILIPLPQSEGRAVDLTGTFAKDSAIWLGGVGGDGDIEATDSEDNLYEIHTNPADQNWIILPNAEDPDQTRIRLGRF